MLLGLSWITTCRMLCGSSAPKNQELNGVTLFKFSPTLNGIASSLASKNRRRRCSGGTNQIIWTLKKPK